MAQERLILSFSKAPAPAAAPAAVPALAPAAAPAPGSAAAVKSQIKWHENWPIQRALLDKVYRDKVSFLSLWSYNVVIVAVFFLKAHLPSTRGLKKATVFQQLTDELFATPLFAGLTVIASNTLREKYKCIMSTCRTKMALTKDGSNISRLPSAENDKDDYFQLLVTASNIAKEEDDFSAKKEAAEKLKQKTKACMVGIESHVQSGRTKSFLDDSSDDESPCNCVVDVDVDAEDDAVDAADAADDPFLTPVKLPLDANGEAFDPSTQMPTKKKKKKKSTSSSAPISGSKEEFDFGSFMMARDASQQRQFDLQQQQIALDKEKIALDKAKSAHQMEMEKEQNAHHIAMEKEKMALKKRKLELKERKLTLVNEASAAKTDA